MIGGNVTDQVEFVVISEKLAAMIHEGENLLLDMKNKDVRDYEERKDVCREAWDKYTDHVRQFLPEELQAHMKTLVSDDKVFSNILPPGEIGRYEYAIIEIPELAPIRARIDKVDAPMLHGEIYKVSYQVSGIQNGDAEGEPFLSFNKYCISKPFELYEALGVAKNIYDEFEKRHTDWANWQAGAAQRRQEASYVDVDEPAVISLINMAELVKVIRDVVKEDRI
jgi:hypothetical protein